MAKISGQSISGGSVALMVVRRCSLAFPLVSICPVTGVLQPSASPGLVGFGQGFSQAWADLVASVHRNWPESASSECTIVRCLQLEWVQVLAKFPFLLAQVVLAHGEVGLLGFGCGLFVCFGLF